MNSRDEETRIRIEEVFRLESRRAFAVLVRHFGDFDLAEDALQDAFRAALESWPQTGLPDRPLAWLVSTARHKALDVLRRRARTDALTPADEALLANDPTSDTPDLGTVGDEVLRLVFTCCHPALGTEAQIALTLREVCELTTEEIAKAFLVPAPTLAQRIVRAKAKIRDSKIPFEVPDPVDLPGRLDAVLRTVYLVFNEGYSASSGDDLIRHDLVDEAVRLGRLLADLLPEPEVLGLLALMLSARARRAARLSPDGDIVLLEDQDRSLWDTAAITEASNLVQEAIRTQGYAAYTVQAAISVVHSEAPTYGDTDWNEIVGLYDVLLHMEPSPIVELNRAVAVAMRTGPEASLGTVERLIESGGLAEYHFAHAFAADLYARSGQREKAAAAFHRAIGLAPLEAERRLLQRKLDAL
ncbi:MAG: RNA polymerase sigma factor [Armatimonadetes bacterium]|nr:RNA polymerase sigma factor [Armatimonadota bacterium]